MRAVWLATTRLGRRRRSPITHGSVLVAFERSRLALAPLIRSRRKYWLPRLDIPPRRCLPPVDFCRSTRPSQAANSRPLRKPLGSTTVAAIAVELTGPMPGTLARRWSHRVALMPSHELLLDRRNRRLQLLNLYGQHLCTWRAKSGRRPSPSSRTMAISLPTSPNPCGAITPNSARCPRKAFTRPVRWRTSRSGHGAAARQLAGQPS